VSKEYEFRLTPAERASSTHIKYQAHFEYLLKRERAKNDIPISEDKTNLTRGRISLAKELIGLGTKPKPEDDEEQD